MSTSESDGYDSADGKLNSHQPHQAKASHLSVSFKRYTSIGSDSDDDIEYIPPSAYQNQQNQYKDSSKKRNNKSVKYTMESELTTDDVDKMNSEQNIENNKDDHLSKDLNKLTLKHKKNVGKSKEEAHSINNASTTKDKDVTEKQERPQKQRKGKEIQSLGAKKLGSTKIEKSAVVKAMSPNEVRNKLACKVESSQQSSRKEMIDSEEKKSLKDGPNEMPSELMSNLKFKDIFKPDVWDSVENEAIVANDHGDNKYKPVLNKLAHSAEQENSVWGGWGSWGVSSLINTATAGVSTLTSHVSQGLSLLEETMGIPDPEVSIKDESPLEEKILMEDPNLSEKTKEISEEKLKSDSTEEESPIQYLPTSFGFGNFMSGVSTLTKLVETTGTKVITGGLDTLEVIGKKTMEVLQEGDPGLKKKRILFLNDPNKPILSQILREAKDKADIEEKMLEEKNLAKKVRFESLFDDYQGLVHLEALEMLSKQCKMKIQTHLDNLEEDDLSYIQGVLEEIVELCDPDSDDGENNENQNKSLELKLETASKDLGIDITYSKLIDVWNEMNTELNVQEITNRDVYEKAISGLAKFTAYSVELFHKTAELLLIKKRRSTVNESDSLVQLTKILSSQMVSISNLYSSKIDKNKIEIPKFDVHQGLTTITKEANNAYSYIQEAFMLLIPIVQIGVL